MTSWRVLEYDYESHEGKYFIYSEFDSTEIKTNSNSEQNYILYSSGLGPFSIPINPPDFKKLQSPNNVIFLKQGNEAFRFTQVEDLEKLTKTLNDIDEQRNLTTDTTDITKADQKPSKKETKVTIKCTQCGKGVTSDSKFCNYCGARMTPVCSKCNHENPVGSQYCSNCGFVLN